MFILFFFILMICTEGDGRLGYPEGGPYDAIHVGAAAESLPEEASAMFCDFQEEGEFFRNPI